VHHEIVSRLVHVDVYLFPASETRPYMTLATIGMSTLPMTVDNVEGEIEALRRAEIFLYVDYDWDFASPVGDWPTELLQDIARYPHRYKTWIFAGHTIGSGEGTPSAKPLVHGSLLTDILFRYPEREPEGFWHLNLPNGEPCHFLWLTPLTVAESFVKRTEGTGVIAELLDTAGIVTIDVDRACLASKESRQQRRARVRAQRLRERRPRLKTVMELECDVHDYQASPSELQDHEASPGDFEDER
jgi:hypothetical protein